MPEFSHRLVRGGPAPQWWRGFAADGR